MLGTPLVVPACQKHPPRFPGEVRGASAKLGHRLRGAWVEHAGAETERIGVAIVGAGPAGLCAGWRLSRASFHDYRIYDLEPRPGGTSVYGTDGVVPYPWGAHYVPVPMAENRALCVLLEEMGVLDWSDGVPVARERYRVREPDERLFYDGAWHPGLFPASRATERDRADLVAFERHVKRWLGFRDAQGRRAFALPMRRSSDDARLRALDKLSAADWLRQQGIQAPHVLWYLELACRDDYGTTLEETSAWALLFYFCARRASPALESQPFITWPEGNGRLVEHLAGRSKGRLRTRCLVTDVVQEAERVRLAVFDAARDELRLVVADQVILAIPQFVAQRVLRAWRDAAPKHVSSFSYGPWLVANLHLATTPSGKGAPPAWDNVLFDSPSLGYVSAGHQALRDVGPDVWTYYLPLTGHDVEKERERLLALDHQSWARAIVADLERAHPDISEQVKRIDIYKWGHAMIRPTPGFIWGAERLEPQAKAPARVHFAHSDLSGIALFEEAQDRGILAAEAVLRALGRESEPLAG